MPCYCKILPDLSTSAQLPDHYHEICDAYKSQDYENCIKIIDKSESKFSEYKILRAVCYLKLPQTNIEKCYQLLDGLIKFEPNNYYAIFAKGLAQFTDGQYDASIKSFDKALELNSSNTMEQAKVMRQKAIKLLKETDKKPVIIESIKREFKCVLCLQKSFTKKFNLDRHRMKVHGAAPTPSMARLPKPKELKRRSCPLTSRPIKCLLCDKSFTKRFSLSRHMNSHNGIRPHKCSMCDFAFIQKSDMLRHEETHFTDLRYRCSVCRKRFKTKKNLDCHRRKHHKNVKDESTYQLGSEDEEMSELEQ